MVIVKGLTKVFEVALVAIIALQALLMMASVGFRYVLNSPILWTDEVIRYSLVWLTFAGLALATKERTHIDVDVIDNVLPPLGRKITNVLVDCVVVAFMLFLVFYGAKITDYMRGSYGETLQFLNQSYPYASIPIGALMTILITVSKYFVRETPVPSEQVNADLR